MEAWHNRLIAAYGSLILVDSPFGKLLLINLMMFSALRALVEFDVMLSDEYLLIIPVTCVMV